MGRPAAEIDELLGAYSYFFGTIILAGMEVFKLADTEVLVSSLKTLYAPLEKMAAPAAILKEFTSTMTSD
jgi:hypothetical protein